MKKLSNEAQALKAEQEFVSTVDRFFEIVLELAAVGVDQLLKVSPCSISPLGEKTTLIKR